MTRPANRRTTGRVLICSGTALLAAALLPIAFAVTATAADEPGSAFSSFALAANAPAVQIRQVDGGNCGGEPAATGGCEGVIPEAVSTLRNGPVGFALSSVVWPGVLAGNLGSLLVVAGDGQVPDDARQLDSPVRAEARSGGDGKEVVNDDYPGARMVAKATDFEVTAQATVTDETASPAGRQGSSSGATRTAVTGPRTAVSEAKSSAKDLSLAGGVVTIGSVTSEAKATTDGVKADATGKTVTSGVVIGGVPVTIDERGVTVAGTSAPLNSTAAGVVNMAIKNAGMTIAVSQPSKTVEGGSVQYDSGSVVFFWQQQPGTSTTVILGGTRVTATASPGFDFGGGPVTGGTTGGAPPVTGGTGVTTPPVVDAPVVPGTVAPVEAPPAVVAEAPPAPFTAELAAARQALPGGLSPVVVVLGLLGGGLMAAGFRRLPDRVLEATPATCLLEETP